MVQASTPPDDLAPRGTKIHWKWKFLFLNTLYGILCLPDIFVGIMVQIKRTCRHFQLFQSLKSSLLRNFYLPKFAHFEKQILFLEHPVMYSLLSRYISCHTCLNKRNSKSFRKFLELRVAFTKFRHFYLTKIQKIWKFFFQILWIFVR